MSRINLAPRGMGVRPDSYRDPPPALKNRRMSVFLFWSVTEIDRIAKTLPPHTPFIPLVCILIYLFDEITSTRNKGNHIHSEVFGPIMRFRPLFLSVKGPDRNLGVRAYYQGIGQSTLSGSKK